MSIIKFIIWVAIVTGVATIVNMILILPLGIYAQKKWGPRCETPLTEGVPILNAIPNKGVMPILYGLFCGILVGGGIALITRLYVSPHWFYQIFLALGFFFAAGKVQKRYLTTGTRGPFMFGLTGDRTIAAMYGFYSWGALFAIIALGLWSWLV
ncbi:MAG: hypothetical protein L0196_03565 [candidate division Zixibacteria bacterium]|nr:hypothetical protein [candidate division Zixibacteria bacterium]